MFFNEVQPILTFLTSLVALVVAATAALWAYAKLVLERGYLPPLQFTLACRHIAKHGATEVIELAAVVRNMGSSTAVVKNLRLDIRYLAPGDPATLLDDSAKATFGRLNFPHSVRKQLSESLEAERGFLLVPHHTFIQPGVEQRYPLITLIPSSSVILAWSAFEYAQRPSGLQHAVLWISRRLGLVQFTLRHITTPHTAESAFAVGETTSDIDTGGLTSR